MQQDNCNRIIESLQVKYHSSGMRMAKSPMQLSNTKEQKNILVQAKAGYFTAGKDERQLPKDEFYFIPGGQPIYMKHGRNDTYKTFRNTWHSSIDEMDDFLEPINSNNPARKTKDVLSTLNFEVSIYGIIPFFSIIELPCINIPYDEELTYLLDNIITEDENHLVGKNSMIECLLKETVIKICRYICEKPELKPYTDRLTYLLDKRLVKIIQYVQENLASDLSNEKIAEVAFVSKDYVGQFFKTLTGKNLQDYIENRRLELAHYLLRTSTDNIQEIARMVGFKDPAYFSRRFKMRYNENAKVIKKAGDFAF